MIPQDATVILGAGFTGLFTAFHLSRHQYSQPVVIIDRQERFTFSPLLYEFLSGEMRKEQVWPRYEDLLTGSNSQFVQDTVEEIDLKERSLRLASQPSPLKYRYLVLALGSSIGYFGVEGAKEHSFPFRTGKQAVALAKHLRECLSAAIQTDTPQQRRHLTTVAIVGAGPSGIELAATLADLLPNWYSELGGNPQEIRVLGIDMSDDILNSQGNDKTNLRETAYQTLNERAVSVELLLEAKVCRVRSDGLEYQDKDEHQQNIPVATVVWTAGTDTLPLLRNLSIPDSKRDRFGRLCVTPTLQLLDFPEVLAGGDCAAVVENSLPLTAQVAYQQGEAIARNLVALAENKELSPAEVNFRGTLLKLGLGESAAYLFDRLEIRGKLGHLIRQATYLQLLPTPIHNFKAAGEWLSDEVFHRYSNPANLDKLATSLVDVSSSN
ncbi:MAG: NAD(P)/FAD-dependent oxidoreductase [Cyanophyceae cyanobacterium]